MLSRAVSTETEYSVDCIQSGPVSIESVTDEVFAGPLLLQEAIRAEREGYDAFVVYCFSDLAITALRENVDIPVIGPGECALAAADILSNKFCVITTVEGNVSRTYRRLMQNPITQKKLSSVRALNIPVAELRDDPDATCVYLKKVCAEAVAEDGIDTVVLGCLGLAQYGEEVEKECGVKVIDPAFVALGCAELGSSNCLEAEPSLSCRIQEKSRMKADNCIALLQQMVAIPSESQNEQAFAEFLANYLREELSMETQLQHVEGKSYNVIGRWNSGPHEKKLILGGHIDTVSPTPRWETDVINSAHAAMSFTGSVRLI